MNTSGAAWASAAVSSSASDPSTLGFLVLFGDRSARPESAFAAITGAAALEAMHSALLLVERRAIGALYGR